MFAHDSEESRRSLYPRPAPPAASDRLPPKIADELGRTWVLPADNAGMFELVNEFGRRHGRPSRAVQEAFRRHEKLNVLRMLVLRGAEGERVNLAGRALALGPMPPARLPTPRVRAGWPTPEEQLRRLAEAQARRDELCLADLRAEAADFRGRGYTD